MTRLCKTCQETDFAYVLDPGAWNAKSPNFEGIQVLHHESLAGLHQAMVEGCLLCKLFAGALGLYSDPDYPEVSNRPWNKRSTREGRPTVEYYPGDWGPCLIYPLYESDLLHATYSPHRTAVFGLCYQVKSTSLAANLRVTPVEGESRGIATRRLDDSNAKICMQWLDTCFREHKDCDDLEDTDLPSRLIDLGTVGGESTPYLKHTAGQKGRYVTLSHCWGASLPPMTTKANISARESSIPYHEMPRTFYDAAGIVLELGYQFLWIDTYCIVQDCPKDWQYECSRMNETYAHSVFTLAAPNASDCNTGIPRSGRPVTDVSCDIVIHWQDIGTASKVRISTPFEWQDKQFGFDSSELGKRAWFLQERLLTPRVLYFDADRLRFECKSVQCVERIRYPLDPWTLTVNAFQHVSKDALSWVTREEGLAWWYSIVDTYSRLEITYQHDRLPALSGLLRYLLESSMMNLLPVRGRVTSCMG